MDWFTRSPAVCVWLVTTCVFGQEFADRQGEFLQSPSSRFLDKVRAEIAAVKARSPDELLPALDLEWVVFRSGVQDGVNILPELDFPRVLADRNVRKLDQVLGQADEADRRRQIDLLNEKALARHIELKEAALQLLDQPPPRFRDSADIPKPPPISGRRVAYCSTLYLAAKYCGVKTVARMLQDAIDYADRLPSRIGAKPFATENHRRRMVESFLPDQTFELNVLVYAAQCDRTITERQQTELRSHVEQAVSAHLVRYDDVEIRPWDAEVDWFDERLRGIAAETQGRGDSQEVVRWYQWRDAGIADKENLISSIRRSLEIPTQVP